MRFQTPLLPATLLRRYNRFLADIRLEDGQEVTAHCPNPGAMMGLKDEGLRIWVEPNDDPRKKLNYGWRVVELPDGHYAGIDTSVPNRVVGEALAAGQITELVAYENARPEVKYGQNSRIDYLLTGEGKPDAYVEVKNVHLRRDGDWAEFPDSVTTRGAKHLRELSDMVAQGHRSYMLYLVQRTDCARFRLAPDLDPAYAVAFDAARAAGVEMLCYDTEVSPEGVTLRRALPVEAGPQSLS
ncbi:DNA/RNA nuclease SfsA [Litoreibacter roseus]|uniref:Sugar fermentation stimulation protein homolog n=1 Tax=Litoreibacter roseus TaxID=2601869 RepID=A0A6N6JED2_9RHOB|nr:DNA/RNA nuclease SfsA [Litoreibacter roseus]GFE64495.1 sugar fermentation stimulation protein [Litoreibacter roseus]